MRTCKRCNAEKDITEFRKRSKRTYQMYGNNQYDNVCTMCRIQYDKIRHEENRDKEKEQVDLRVSTLNGRYIRWKANAKVRKIAWDLSLNQLEGLPLICHYTGVELSLKPKQTNTISLDRIDSNKGYSLDNIVLCCSRINLMKNELNQSEFLDWCKKVVKHIND